MCCIWNEATRRFKGLTVWNDLTTPTGLGVKFELWLTCLDRAGTAHPLSGCHTSFFGKGLILEGELSTISSSSSRAIDRGRVMDARELISEH